MAARKKISASVRWSVFARDDFRCGYCGRQAGQDDTELVIDHVVSVADGGDNSITNLFTACQRCNGGKGARSLSAAPIDGGAVARVEEEAKRRAEFAAAQRALVEAAKARQQARAEIIQLAVNAHCEAYGVESVTWQKRDDATMANMVEQVGIELVTEWFETAARNRVPENHAIRYICGCRRNYLKSLDEGGE